LILFRKFSFAFEVVEVYIVARNLLRPGQIVSGRGHLKAYQSTCDIGGKMFLLRAIVDDSMDPAVVVTAYRTTRIEKYWGKP